MSEHSGAVLCKDEILDLCDTHTPLIGDLEEGHLGGAKYDLRIATTGMILPSGKVIKAETDKPHTAMILLKPGQTLFVSTLERLHMPHNLVGNMSIKGDLSRMGILSLTGMIVDPGYTSGPSEDGRLHFRLANLGSRAVALKPGVTPVASIQFLPLARDTEGPPDVPNVWDDPQDLQEGLGFIDDLGKLKKELKGLTRDFENQRRSTEYVIAAAVGLILATILGVVITALLSLGANSNLTKAAKNVVPDDGQGQWLFVIGLFGLATIAWAIVVGWARGRRPAGPVPLSHQRTEQEAVRDFEVSRMRWVCLGIGAAGLITWGAIGVSMSVLEAPTAVNVVVGVVVGVLSIVAVMRFAWRPITQSEVDRRLALWHDEDS